MKEETAITEQDNMATSNIGTVPAKTILQKVRYGGDQWFGIDYSMNLYRGCCHGCIYCDSRSECYQVDNFDQVCVKENVLEILERELRSKRQKGVVGLGAMSDSYNPFERKLEVTRDALRLLAEYGFGVSLETKSPLITRDIDLFTAIARKHSVIAKITITTTDDDLARIIEPGAPSSSARFEALSELATSGVFCGVLFMPSLPFITDDQDTVRAVVEETAASGAKFIYRMEGVTMRDRQRDYFYAKAAALDPNLPSRYQKAFGDRYVCNSPHARENEKLFRSLCDEYGLLYRMPDIIKGYKREIGPIQQSLF